MQKKLAQAEAEVKLRLNRKNFNLTENLDLAEYCITSKKQKRNYLIKMKLKLRLVRQWEKM